MKRLSLVFGLLLAFASVANAQLPPIKPAPTQPGRGYKPLAPEKRKAFHEHSAAKHGGRLAMLAKFKDVPPAFDCRAKGWVLPVGDQAQCGSCYLYSTVYGTMSQAFVKAGYGKPDGSFVMAVQFGMDCQDFGGCNGGNGTEVIDWACKNGWPAEKWVDTAGVSHNDYPAYEANPRSCRKVAGAKYWTPASWGFVAASSSRPATTLEIKTALVNFGPLNVSLDAGGQFGNGTGTITSLGNNVDHEIEMVAYDDAKDGGAFLLKNQWTTDWGIGGYRWVTYQAAQNLVDVFFVTASALPPPPDPVPPGPAPPGPPVPPVPPSPGTVTITLTTDQVQSVVSQSGASLITGTTTIAELVSILNKAAKVPMVPTKAEPPTLNNSLEKDVQDLKNAMPVLIDAIKTLQKQMMLTEKKTSQMPAQTTTVVRSAEVYPPRTNEERVQYWRETYAALDVKTGRTLTAPERLQWWRGNYPQYASKP